MAARMGRSAGNARSASRAAAMTWVVFPSACRAASQSRYARGCVLPSLRAKAASPLVPSRKRIASRSQRSAEVPSCSRRKATHARRKGSRSGSGRSETRIRSSSMTGLSPRRSRKSCIASNSRAGRLASDSVS